MVASCGAATRGCATTGSPKSSEVQTGAELPAIPEAGFTLTDHARSADVHRLRAPEVVLGISLAIKRLTDHIRFGQYTATLLVQGGLADQDDGVLGSVAFEADVNGPTSESPEPQPRWMLAPAMGGLALARCRRGRKS